MSKETNYADLQAGKATCEFCGHPVTLSAVVDTVDVGTFGNEGRKLRLAICPACGKQPEFVSDK